MRSLAKRLALFTSLGIGTVCSHLVLFGSIGDTYEAAWARLSATLHQLDPVSIASQWRARGFRVIRTADSGDGASGTPAGSSDDSADDSSSDDGAAADTKTAAPTPAPAPASAPAAAPATDATVATATAAAPAPAPVVAATPAPAPAPTAAPAPSSTTTPAAGAPIPAPLLEATTAQTLPGFIGAPVFNVPLAIDIGQQVPQVTSVAVTWQIAGLSGDVTPVGYGPTYTPADADRGLILSAILTPFNGTTAGPTMTIPGMIVQ